MPADEVIWEMDASLVAQLVHAELSASGAKCQWSVWYDPDQDLIDEFEKLAQSPEDDFES